ncbi:MAG TPA: hypothetical protein VJ978_06060 [Nitriliruptoraceae bacterium]|nr:hypothetical protein [Nitriliruptoraceae bacterium]
MFEPDLQGHAAKALMEVVGGLEGDEEVRGPAHHAIPLLHESGQFTEVGAGPIHVGLDVVVAAGGFNSG